MKRNFIVMLAVTFINFWSTAAICALAQDETSESQAQASNNDPVDESFAAIELEFRDAMRAASQAAMEESRKQLEEYKKGLEDASDEEKESLESQGAPPMKAFSPLDQLFVVEYLNRAVGYVSKNADNDDVGDALAFVLMYGKPDSEEKRDAWNTAATILKEKFVDSPKIEQSIVALSRSGSADGMAILESIAKTSNVRLNKALALKAMITANESLNQRANFLSSNAHFRALETKRIGEEVVNKLLDGIETRAENMKLLSAQLQRDYSDIFPDLSIGQPAPATMGREIDGTSVELSTFKGNVVVLDVWTTWCGPCRAMIPHEREMVERLTDKPFKLISVSMDKEVDALTDFLEENEMPWMHWWCGQDKDFSRRWDIQYYPTIYVIDAKGMIRFKDLRGEELEEAVNKLLEEIE